MFHRHQLELMMKFPLFMSNRRKPIYNEESTTVPEQIVTEPRRSGRVSRNPVCYGLDGETNMVVGDTSDDDPLSFK